MAIIKIFAWFTITEQGWITRWHKSRSRKAQHLPVFQGAIMTGVILVLISLGGLYWQNYVANRIQNSAEAAMRELRYSDIKLENLEQVRREPVLPETAIKAGDYKVYIVQPGDSLIAVSQKLNIDLDALRRINFITNRNHIEIGQKLYHP